MTPTEREVIRADCSRLYPVDYRWACYIRLWHTGKLHGGAVTDAELLTELRGIIGDLQVVASELEAANIQPTKIGWLDE